MEEATPTAIELWPDNALAYNVFVSSVTQWRMVGAGMGGAYPTGLDYASLESTLRMLRVPRSEWPQVFEDVRVMEDAALAQMRLTQERKANG